MKIALVSPAFENLGIEYISAVLKIHHEVIFAFDPLLFNDSYIHIGFLAKLFDYTQILLKQLEEEKPQLIAFGVMSDTYEWACTLAKRIKEHLGNIPIVFGGFHVTAVPEHVLNNWFVDYVVVGEGEYPMLELADAIEQGQSVSSIMNVGYKVGRQLVVNPPRPLIQDLDVLPFPDKDLFFSRNPYRLYDYGIITSRGCYYSCTYCHNSADRKLAWNKQGHYFRQRSVDNVIEELRNAKEKYGFKSVSIWDECFTFNEDWLRVFCRRYKQEIALPFWTNVHPDHVSEEKIRLLEEAGCTRVEMGVQILNPEIKRTVLKRNETKETIEKVIRLFRKSKIRIEIDIILGVPLMQEEDYKELADCFNKVKPASIHTFWLRYYPSTEIVEIAKKHKILSDDEIEKIERGEPSTSSILGGSTIDKRLEKYQTLLTFLPYLSEKTVNRIITRNWIQYIPSITALNRIVLYLLDLKNNDEVIGKRYIKKTKYFILQKIKRWLLHKQ